MLHFKFQIGLELFGKYKESDVLICSKYDFLFLFWEITEQKNIKIIQVSLGITKKPAGKKES